MQDTGLDQRLCRNRRLLLTDSDLSAVAGECRGKAGTSPNAEHLQPTLVPSVSGVCHRRELPVVGRCMVIVLSLIWFVNHWLWWNDAVVRETGRNQGLSPSTRQHFLLTRSSRNARRWHRMRLRVARECSAWMPQPRPCTLANQRGTSAENWKRAPRPIRKTTCSETRGATRHRVAPSVFTAGRTVGPLGRSPRQGRVDQASH